jgi:hypothetical protein
MPKALLFSLTLTIAALFTLPTSAHAQYGTLPIGTFTTAKNLVTTGAPAPMNPARKAKYSFETLRRPTHRLSTA